MNYNTAIYQEFRNYAIDWLNDDLLSIKEQIYKNSLFRYGNLEDKINVIEELKQDTGTHFNFLRVKGVEYKQGEFQIIETEFKELIDENRVNLENYNFGLFENENDKDKVLALKSYNQVLFILSYCLKLQILNEAKQQLEKPQLDFKPNNFEQPTYHHPIFKTAVDEEFFMNRIKKPGKHKRKFVSCLFDAMISKIKVNQSDFAIYWNSQFSEIHKIKVYSKNRFGIDTPLKDEPLRIEIDKELRDFKKTKEQ